jgi:hypothetical protein
VRNSMKVVSIRVTINVGWLYKTAQYLHFILHTCVLF